MTTPDPRTDLAGYLGLTDERAAWCRRLAIRNDDTLYGKVGARLIEQDQARADEPDDGLIPVTVRLTAEEVRARTRIKVEYDNNAFHSPLAKLDDACRAIDYLPAPKPPWKSPLADLPDLTEEQCRDAYYATMAQPDTPYLNGVIGRALIAAGYTPEEEA